MKKRTAMKKGVFFLVLFVIINSSSVFAQINLRREGNYKKGLAVASSNRKYGYIDENNKVVIPIVYDEANDFSDDGIAFVKKNGKWGAIDRTGSVKIPISYFIIKRSKTDQGMVFVGQRDPVNCEINWGIYNDIEDGKTGKQIAPCESVFEKKEDLDLIKCDDYGVFVFGDHIYKDVSGKFTSLLPKQYYVFNKSRAKETGLVIITNHNIGRDFDDRLLGLYDIKIKKMIADCIYKGMTVCNDQTIAVKDQNDKIGAINRQGCVKIPFQYDHFDYLPSFSMFRVFVGYKTDHEKSGLITCDGAILCPPEYDFVTPYDYYGKGNSDKDSYFISAGFVNNRHNRETKTIIARDGSIRKIDPKSIISTGDENIYSVNNDKLYIVRDLITGKYGIMAGYKPAIFPSGYSESTNPLEVKYVLVDFMYDKIEKKGDYYFATNDNKYGILGQYASLKKTDCCVYDGFEIVYGDICMAIKNGTTYFMNYRDGQELFSVKKSIEKTKRLSKNCDLWEIVSEDHKHGVVKISYNSVRLIIPCGYDEILMEGKAIIVKKEKKYGAMNTDGLSIFPCIYDKVDTDGDVFVVKKNDKYGVVLNGGSKEPSMWFEELDYSNRWNAYCFWYKIDKDGLWGLALFKKDNTIRVLIKPEYDSVISKDRVKKGKKTYEIVYDRSHDKFSRNKIRE